MTAPPPRRPRWKRKRTWAALVLVLAVAYPLSAGPFLWAWQNGYVPPKTLTFYRPLVKGDRGPRHWPAVGRFYAGDLDWWALLARDRAAPN